MLFFEELKRRNVIKIATAMLLVASGSQAQSQWTNEDFETLFPSPAIGWQAGGLEVEELDTVTSDFEAGVSGTDAGISIRLKLKRNYTSGEKRIGVTIDSMDFRAAGMVGAVWDDSTSAEQLAKQGITRRTFGSFRGLSAVHEADAGWVINVGSTGVVVIECTYANCFEDTEELVGALDLAEVERFVAFDHRKSE